MPAKRVEFTVSFDLPRGCTVALAQAQVTKELQAMGGGLFPGTAERCCDPMWEYDRATLEVKHNRKKRS
jgi:hypothetical protein